MKQGTTCGYGRRRGLPQLGSIVYQPGLAALIDLVWGGWHPFRVRRCVLGERSGGVAALTPRLTYVSG